MLDRHGIELTDKLETEIINQIHTGSAVLIEKQSLRVSMWEITVEENKIKILYDKMRKQIITAIPKDDSPLNRDNFTTDDIHN
jgi:hypothetical protein